MRTLTAVVLPDTIPENLTDIDDEDLAEQLVASGYDTAAAAFLVDVLRGREEPTLD